MEPCINLPNDARGLLRRSSRFNNSRERSSSRKTECRKSPQLQRHVCHEQISRKSLACRYVVEFCWDTVQKGDKTNKVLSPLFHDAPKLPEYCLWENVQKGELSVERIPSRTCAPEITRGKCGFPSGKEFLGKRRSPCRGSTPRRFFDR